MSATSIKAAMASAAKVDRLARLIAANLPARAIATERWDEIAQKIAAGQIVDPIDRNTAERCREIARLLLLALNLNPEELHEGQCPTCGVGMGR